MNLIKHGIVIAVCLALALFPWHLLSPTVISVKLLIWTTGVILSVVLLRLFGNTKFGYIVYVFVFVTIFLYSSFQIRVNGLSTNLAYASGIFSSMSVDELFLRRNRGDNRRQPGMRWSEKSVNAERRTAKAKDSAGSAPLHVSLSGTFVGANRGQNGDLKPISINVQHTSHNFGSSKINVLADNGEFYTNFSTDEFDNEFMDRHKIVDADEKFNNSIFALRYSYKHYFGTDIADLLGDLPGQDLVVYAPGHDKFQAIVFSSAESKKLYTLIRKNSEVEKS